MRILYVTPLVAGFQDILEGKEESQGLPSFIFPLRKLLEDGNDVDIILVSNFKNSLKVRASWISNKNIIANINNDFANTKGIIRCWYKLKSCFQFMVAVGKALKCNNYDFVYCHGTAAYLGNVLANIFQVRCGYRVYGVVDLAHDIRRYGRLRSVFRYPIYYLISKQPKDFLLITDDGTEGDYAFEILNPCAKYPIYHRVNGIDKSYSFVSPECFLRKIDCNKEEYIFHAGRISRIKRQDRVIDVLGLLHKEGIKLHLVFAGHVSDEKFYDELMVQVKECNLQEYVHFIGPVDRTEMQSLSHWALATVLLGDSSNQGNVFFECAFAGSVIVTYPEKSLQKYIENKTSGFFVEDENSAKSILAELFKGGYNTKNIKNSLKNTVNCKLDSWSKRVQFEVDLIYHNGDVING